jgi:endo-1,4-beta-xylanase
MEAPKMLKRKTAVLFALIMTMVLLLPTNMNIKAEAVWDLTLPSLKDAFADYFVIGNIMEPRRIREATTEAFVHHYNFVTAENAMKPSSISRGRHHYNFSNADIFMAWAEDSNLEIVGHTLVWHSQSPAWLTFDDDGNLLTRAEARANMEEFINEVAGRYAGRINAWDVVNEAFRTSVINIPPNNDWRSSLRQEQEHVEGGLTLWYAAYANGADLEAGECGSDYLYDAFVFTRLADPHAILYYNDFNETDVGKREVIALMTEELNERWETDPRNTEPGRLLIEGLGLQAHYWTGCLSPISVEMTIRRWIETGAQISITELDIPVGRHGRIANEITDEAMQRQTELYEELFEIFLKFSDSIERVTFWGMIDSQSWRSGGLPLIFDGQLQAKPAFFRILNTIPEAVETAEPEDTEETAEVQQTPNAGGAGVSASDDGSDFPFVPVAVGAGVAVVGIAVGVINARRRG